MNCPSEVSRVLLKILATGLLRIRALGWSNDVERCAIEADHLHNLPALLSDYSDEMLRYYWTTERPAYISHNDANGTAAFEALWTQLAPLVPTARVPTLSSSTR
jgi:hypothetical protein